MSKSNVVFAIPTARMKGIDEIIFRYFSIISGLSLGERSIKLIICKNGVSDLKEEGNHKDIEILNIPEKSKNKAMKKILSVIEEDEIVIFLDDDIEFDILLLNKIIDKIDSASPVLVGANFRVRENHLSLFQKIISHPFNSSSPPFCMGGCMGFKKTFFTEFPDNEAADDGYISNYFAQKYGIETIVKIDFAYMKVHEKYRDWMNQQIRIIKGVNAAYLLFNGDDQLLREAFYWKYNESFGLKNIIRYSFKDLLYFMLKIPVDKKVRKDIGNIEWKIIEK